MILLLFAPSNLYKGREADSMSIAETNKIRAELGLAPLDISETDANGEDAAPVSKILDAFKILKIS